MLAGMDLRHGSTTATIDLDGGRLASLRPRGIEVLVTEGERPTRWGSFPMVPWCGRLRDGHLEFDGVGYDLPLTSPPHANHGIAHLQPWSAVSAGDATCVIRTELGEPWPFGGHVVQRFELDDAHLTVTVEVHARHRPMPAMAGWHPWFRRDLGVGEPAELGPGPGPVGVDEREDVPRADPGPLPAQHPHRDHRPFHPLPNVTCTITLT